MSMARRPESYTGVREDGSTATGDRATIPYPAESGYLLMVRNPGDNAVVMAGGRRRDGENNEAGASTQNGADTSFLGPSPMHSTRHAALPPPWTRE